MKIENVQIEIKNKEHYEAVKKRLQELKRWNWSFGNAVDKQALSRNYKSIIGFDEECTVWGDCGYETIILDDLYEVKKEKVTKGFFKVYDATPSFLFSCYTHKQAMDFINSQESGTYEIRKFYEVLEE